MRLNDIGEFRLIDRLAAMLPALPPQVIAGVGDDCAVLDAGGGKALLFAVDACIEGTHFFIETPQIGWKALAANLSDIAAMGGRPTAALVVLGARPDVDVRVVDEIYADLVRASRHYGVPLVGGDTVSTSGPLVLAVSVLGEADADRVLRRDGASPGDALMVVGWLGSALGGLHVYRARREMWTLSSSIATHKPPMDYYGRLAFVTTTLLRNQPQRPQLGDPLATHRLELEFHEPLAHLKAGAALAETGKVTAMIDVSDGLAGDAEKLAQASGVGVRVDMAKLPISPDLAKCYGEGARALALQGGEDYALLFTVRPEDEPAAGAALEAHGYVASTIGHMTADPNELAVVDPSGDEHSLGALSWDHFE